MQLPHTAWYLHAQTRDGTRSTAEAQALYQESVPSFVRNCGEESVSRFLKGKDASHIQSVHNSPDLATDTGNSIWEKLSWNRARGSADMTGYEQFTAQASNAFDAATIAMREYATAAGTSALLARYHFSERAGPSQQRFSINLEKLHSNLKAGQRRIIGLLATS